MWIMVVYILIIMVAEFAVIIIGLVLDRIYPALSLTVSLSLFFVVLWLGWVLAVRVTEPKHAKNKKARDLKSFTVGVVLLSGSFIG